MKSFLQSILKTLKARFSKSEVLVSRKAHRKLLIVEEESESEFIARINNLLSVHEVASIKFQRQIWFPSVDPEKQRKAKKEWIAFVTYWVLE